MTKEAKKILLTGTEDIKDRFSALVVIAKSMEHHSTSEKRYKRIVMAGRVLKLKPWEREELYKVTGYEKMHERFHEFTKPGIQHDKRQVTA